MKLFKKPSYLVTAAIIFVASALFAQSYQEFTNIVLRSRVPYIRFDSNGYIDFQNLAGTSIAQLNGSGALTAKRRVVSASSGSTTLTTAQSGALVLNTGTSSTTTFVLPAASNTGANYCFVEGGDAAGELLVNVATGDSVVGRAITDTAGTGGATAIATATSTGIKNTAASNVKGDMTCLTADGGTKWYMTSVMGVWASQ